MPPLETIGFIPQVTPLLILLILSLVLNLKLFLPTVGQIFAVRKQSSYVLSNSTPSSTGGRTSSLSTSIFGFILLFCIGLSFGITPLIASKKSEERKKTQLETSVWEENSANESAFVHHMHVRNARRSC